jgi:hypothetical protein
MDVHAWAEAHFGGADLGDRRRTRRLVRCAAAIAAHPEKSFPQVFDWDGLRAFYRLCEQPAVTLTSVQGPHWRLTRQSMAGEPLVLILHDTTELDFTAHAALEGAGPIGDGRGRGFLQHNSLAVVPEPRRGLGLAYQQLRVRAAAPPGESSARRRRRGRESDLWPEGIRAAGPAPEGCCWVDVGDRGCDIYEAMAAARGAGHHFLLRLTQDRRVFTAPGLGGPARLLSYARTLAGSAEDVVDIPGRGGRPARSAAVRLAAAPVWVPAPAHAARRRERPVVAAWVIRVWEAEPPAGAEPLEWLLLCSLPTATPQELKARRDWYCCRWLVEVYHDVQKNGCREEDRRFETAGRLGACLAVLAVVAVRVLQLRCALRSQPGEPAEAVAGAAEVLVVRRLLGRPSGPLTVRDFVRGIARLGGFLGRTGDGEPGVRSLWRGYQRLQDLLLGFRLNDSG